MRRRSVSIRRAPRRPSDRARAPSPRSTLPAIRRPSTPSWRWRGRATSPSSRTRRILSAGGLNGRPVGSLAHLTTFSFHPVKTITCGEGGAILTDDDALAQRARDFRNHGMIRDAERLQRHDGPWYYEIQSLGFNYRLTAIQCALGRSQLRKLERFSARRRAIVESYRLAFAGEPRLGLQQQDPTAEPTWHLFTVQVDDRARFFAALQQRGLGPQVHYVAVNDMPYYRSLGHSPSATPIAARAAGRLISLPLYPAMTDGEVEQVIAAVRGALAET